MRILVETGFIVDAAFLGLLLDLGELDPKLRFPVISLEGVKLSRSLKQRSTKPEPLFPTPGSSIATENSPQTSNGSPGSPGSSGRSAHTNRRYQLGVTFEGPDRSIGHEESVEERAHLE
jgi:hypothetical protein